MKKNILIYALLLTGCVQPRPQYLNWQRDLESTPDATVKDRVKVSGFAFPIKTSDTEKGIWDLSEKGQKSFVDAISANVKEPKALASALAEPIVQDKTPTIHDLTTFKKKVVLSVIHDTDFPGDRIARMRIQLELSNKANTSFNNWDKLATVWGTVDLGKLTAASTNSGEIAPTINLLGDAQGSITGKVAMSRALTEELQLNRRFVDINGALEDKKAQLFMDGAPGRDLAGNVVADIIMKADSIVEIRAFKVSGLFDATDHAQSADKVKLEEHAFLLPDVSTDVTATISYDGYVRHVTNKCGIKTVAEGDDKVQIQYEKNITPSTTVTLIKKDEFAFKQWTIVTASGEPIHLKDDVTKGYQLLAFASFNEAKQFARWLIDGKVFAIGRRTICSKDNGPQLSDSDLKDVKVKAITGNPIQR